jgi:hypothetical protein
MALKSVQVKPTLGIMQANGIKAVTVYYSSVRVTLVALKTEI